MSTKSHSAGQFAKFDLARVPSPCFVIDEVAVERNLDILSTLATDSGCKILGALKAFSFWRLAPLMAQHLAGTCASGLWEAQLADKHYDGLVETFAPAYKASEIDDIACLSDHVVFNTPAQLATFGAKAKAQGASLGLRINPEHSEGLVGKYDPCAPGSRLGWPVSKLTPEHVAMVDGLHLHTLCEQGFDPLQRTWAAIETKLLPFAGQLKWLNLGGGHLITAPDYDRPALTGFLRSLGTTMQAQIYLEPGTAIAFDAGILVGEVLDVMENDGPNAILDVSATCHMPDVLEAPYRPALLGESAQGVKIRLGGPSCLAGDVIGVYGFDDVPTPGQRLAFLDQAHYSMVKTTTFNGVQLPGLALWNSDTDALEIVKTFNFQDFEARLS
ncbi:MAG: carboxynorspermidine decarboxylase [Parvibaculales bacterium]